MNIGIFITVRLGSSRLASKAIKDVLGKPIISFLISRMKVINQDYGKIIICTTELNEDRVFDTIAKANGVICFHGDNENIVKRHLQCASKYDIDFIVNVDGDDILCNPEYVKLIIKQANELEKYDVIKTSDLPFGTNSMGYKKDVLKKILAKINGETIDTGWGSLIIDPISFSIVEIKANVLEKSDCRLTLDYEEDFLLFKNIIEKLFVDEQYVTQNAIIEYLNQNPEISQINKHLDEQYWENFYKKKILIESKEGV